MNAADVVKVLRWALNTNTDYPGIPLRFSYGQQDVEPAGYDCHFCKGLRNSRKENFQHSENCPYAFADKVLKEAEKEVRHDEVPSHSTR